VLPKIRLNEVKQKDGHKWIESEQVEKDTTGMWNPKESRRADELQ
jgi:hypothetical protein